MSWFFVRGVYYFKNATDANSYQVPGSLLFLARLEFLCKTGCVPHDFQYKDVTFLFSPRKSHTQVLNYQILLTSVAYCIIPLRVQVRNSFFERYDG